MQPGHLERILRAIQEKNVLEALADLPATDLQTLLLEVTKQRSEKVTPARLIGRYRDDRFVQPSAVDPRVMLALDQIAFSVAADRGFQPIGLSPVCPLGTVSALTNVSQNNIVSTIRITEVVSDSTNVMALE